VHLKIAVSFDRALRGIVSCTAVACVTTFAIEIILRIFDPQVLQVSLSEKTLSYQYDSEIGWAPIPNMEFDFTATRTIHVRNNAMGFRDADYTKETQRPILFLGDSFVWGYDVEENERFTDIIRRRLPNERIVNVGVSGYGTDQEYLLIRRIWDRITPGMVILIFCTDNDRLDNSTNLVYSDVYKPYYVLADNMFKGIPTPISLNYLFRDIWIERKFLTTRLVTALYFAAVHPIVKVPDPTERLIEMIKTFVEEHDAEFMIGLQGPDANLQSWMDQHRVRYARFDGADHYPEHGRHWTPKGHQVVAARLLLLLTQRGASNAVVPLKDATVRKGYDR
jgi:hypothetical protein